jgi:hypothetical protein
VFAFVALRAVIGAMAGTAPMESLSLPVTVQLATSDGGSCWRETDTSGGATKSSPELFRARNG